MIMIIGPIAGVASHLLYYMHGEHHMNSPSLFYFHTALIIALFFYNIQENGHLYSQAFRATAAIVGAYVVPLFVSIIIYRTCFHRLRSFPGPALARVSKLWHVYQARHSLNYQLMERLHEQYGSLVRTGPSEITAFVPEALPTLDGRGNTCTKADWYDLSMPLRALNTIRDKDEHDVRRRVWDKGFGIKALQDYDDRIIKYCAQLERHLADSNGQPVHVNDCFYWFSFDLMGDLMLAKSFNMLMDKKWHHAVLMMRNFMYLLGPLSPAPWLARLGFGIPGAARDWKKWIAWCTQRMAERVTIEPEKRDISSWLIQALEKNGKRKRDWDWLYGDAVAMIVAGSDTVGITMTYVFYRLAASPEYQDKIRRELLSIQVISDIPSLQKLPGLQSVITETLRLHPPIPTGAPRVSGPQGITIDGKYIPPKTTIFVSRYTTARLESAFERAEEFLPERWTSKPEMVRNSSAFAPFSQGRYGCVGKTLAIKELSYVVALIVSKYDVEFAPGEDGVRVWKEMKDEFTAAPGRLELVFKPRYE